MLALPSESQWYLTTRVKLPGPVRGASRGPARNRSHAGPSVQGEVCGLGRGSRRGSGHKSPATPPRQVSLRSTGPPPSLPAPPSAPAAAAASLGPDALWAVPPPSLPRSPPCPAPSRAVSSPTLPVQLNPPPTQGKRQIRSQRTFSLHAVRPRPCPQQHVCEAQKQTSNHRRPRDDTVLSPGPLPHDSGRAVAQHTWTIMDVTMLSKALRREAAIRAAPPGTRDRDSPSAVTYARLRGQHPATPAGGG